MKKKNIGFILFGVAAMQLVSMLISLVILPRVYERQEIPTRLIRFTITSILVSSIIAAVVLICVGLILIIKYREE